MRRRTWLSVRSASVLTIVLPAMFGVATACSSGDDGPPRLERIDGPAQLDPEFLEDHQTGGGSDSGG